MTGLADRPFDRPDGKLKVTGAARYAADHPTENLLNGAFACATIAHGKIRALHTDAAKTAPGVRAVLTAETMPRFAALKDSPAGQTFMPMQDDHIEYEGQPIALLLAERLEQATYAASLVRADYEEAPAETDFRRGLDRQVKLDVWQWWAPTDSSTGDVEAALSAAPAKLAATYRTSDRHHNPIEPAATIAQWQDGKLLIWDAAQGLGAVRAVLAQALGLDPRDIRVRADFIGGGFGCKGYVWPHQVLAAAAARVVGRPVKIVLTRAQDYTSHGYQPATEQTIALAAQTDGALAGVRHHVVTPTALSDDYVEFAAIGTRSLYASPAIETRHRAVRVARSRPTPMRAPHEGPGLVALEIAMDELAAQLRIDPVELRLRNYSDEDAGKPFSSKKLRECYTQGARLFGWSGRDPRPGSMRQGRELVGYGMATAAMTTFRNAAKARATIDRSGEVLIEACTQEIGTGVSGVMVHVAAETLGVPVEAVRVKIGDTDLPESPMTAGSSSTLSVGSAVQDAAMKLRARLQALSATGDGALPNEYGALLGRHGLERVSADGEWVPAAQPAFAYSSFGAIFVEVRVDEDLRLPRLKRAVGVYSAGRIVNPKTARSQLIGGITWGVGQALLEASEMDRKLGRYLSKNLAGYLVPVNADIGEIDVSFADELDPHASAIGARGIGELAATGIGPAIANAVFHATGVRVRELPIRPEHLI
jgi:xanthine dehydrogenase YagR molybdenum-binding subunit